MKDKVKDSELLKLSEADRYIAKLLLTPTGNPGNDELITNASAYHAQQAIEKLLKYILSAYGGMEEESKQFKTHNISAIISKIEELCDYTISDELKMAAVMITNWEAQKRYKGSPSANIKDIEETLSRYDELHKEIQELEKTGEEDAEGEG